MPLRNRVTPFGEIVAVAGRGTLMGNRGVLHDAQRRLVRERQVRRWIACRLEFRGRHRAVMAPGRWTELFFLDEATALAAGHRPCAECRHADYRAFQEAWRRAFPNSSGRADALDVALDAERRTGRGKRPSHSARLQDLPDGTYVAIDNAAWLVHGDNLLAWSSEGYRERRRRPASGQVTLLTPPSIVAVVRAGYTVRLHPSVDG